MRRLYVYVANESTPNNQNYVNSAARASCFLVHFVAVTANYSVKLSNVTYDRNEDVDTRRQIFLSISIL